jgi:hypothetical protein
MEWLLRRLCATLTSLSKQRDSISARSPECGTSAPDSHYNRNNKQGYIERISFSIVQKDLGDYRIDDTQDKRRECP